ncbi:WEE1 protein [Gonium pectorale]|uniref:WEE1 protein n=1 Tax=Gonium pectorale TaxID=33097 RepID=A0A150GVV1_GONPE|nr:WEE1 protein [Gonium pectorale]|eukprot:KXZ53818.1 WEE1 protein [Gonium pectorale]
MAPLTLCCSTPDYLTPQEQQFRMEYEPSSMQLDDDASRSPMPSPRAQKRPRPLKVLPAGRPPIPRLRDVQPPMPRNPYLVRADDDNHVFQASQSCLNRGNYSRYHWDYHQEAELGHGNFSKVYRSVHRLTGVAYAIKTNRNPIMTLQARNMWLNEMQALAAVQPHPNIVGLYDAWFEPGGDAEQAFLKLELCSESMRDVFKRLGQVKEADVLDMLRQMASALKRIHELGMVHLDIKPDNIYLAVSGHTASTSSSSGLVYKLGDFGLAAGPAGQRAGTSEGDSKYLAPEALKSRDFLSSGFADRLDIFALGAAAYELLRGSELPKNGQLYHDIRNGKIFLPSVSGRVVALLKKMMAPEPQNRPTADNLLRLLTEKFSVQGSAHKDSQQGMNTSQ